MVFYRKYRPQVLSELIGQEYVQQTLLKAALNNSLAHAYLFCGPRGTGKTSTARILAKIVNCEQIADGKSQIDDEKATRDQRSAISIPCNQCQSCLAITTGTSLDLIEIDAASNRGIDDIRALRETIKLTPTQSKKKVYIIDEVHMLTTEAFNALLKTLEEPPAHAFFILATTESQKIPATILSRVQRLDFQPAKVADLVLALQKIVKDEKLDVDDAALELIAKRAEGSFRDSQKLLDQFASSGEKVTIKMVSDGLKSGSFDDVQTLIQALSRKNVQEALAIVHQQLVQGTNLKEFAHTILETLRLLLLIQNGAKKVAVREIGESQAEALTDLVPTMQSTQLISLISSFQSAVEKMKVTSIPVLPLEVAVVESCSQVTSAVSYQSSEKESENRRLKSEEIIISEQTQEKLEEAKEAQGIEEEQMRTEIPMVTVVADTVSPELSKLLDKWTYILETIKPYNYSLEAMLRQVKVKSCEDGSVVLEVPYSFHQRILEAPKSRELLESVIGDVLGRSAKVRCVIGQRPVRVEEIANVELAADDEIIRVAAEIFNS